MLRLASNHASKVRLLSSTFQPVCCTWSRSYFCSFEPWILEYGKYSECKNAFNKALITELLKEQYTIDAVANFDSLCHGVRIAIDAVEGYLKSRTQKITTFEEIAQVATIAACGDREIGEIVAKARTTVAARAEFLICDGDGKTPFIEFDSYNEMLLHNWYSVSPYFSDVLHNPLILIHEKKITNFDVIKLAIEQATESCRPLLIVAEDIERAFLGYLMADEACIGTKVCVIRPRMLNDKKGVMEDLAILTRGQVLDGVYNMNFTHSMPLMLGSCKKFTLSPKITVRGGSGDWVDIHSRCEQLKSTLKNSTSNELKMHWELESRIRQLSGGAAILKVGGGSEVEVKEKKDRVEKAVRASSSAIKNGFLPGDGVALLYASKELDNLQTTNSDEKIGIELLQNALKLPMHSIVSNTGVDGSIVLDKLLNQDNPDLGYDPLRGEYIDMNKSGIIEPVPITTDVFWRVRREISDHLQTERLKAQSATDNLSYTMNDPPAMKGTEAAVLLV